jgi:TonB family protein
MSVDKHDSDQLQRYLNGEMTDQERHAFERKALDDPFLQEALEGAESIDAKNFASDVTSLQQRLVSATTRFIWWRVAAVVALFILGGWSVWTLVDTQPDKVLTQNEEIAKDLEPESSDTLELEEVIEETEVTVSKPVARVEPTPVAKTKNEGASASASPIPAVNQTVPVPSEVFIEDDMEMDEISEMAFEEVTSDEFAKAEKEKKTISGGAARAQAKKASPVAHNRSWFQTSNVPLNEKRVFGQVTDDFGDPLPGVNVVIKGSTTGVTTDLDGSYELKLPENDPVIVVSSVGMQTQEVEVGERTEIDVYLSSDNAALQEVVVTGYGSFENDPEGFLETEPAMGLAEFKKYLEENLFYPEEAIGLGIEGRVVLQLTISVIGNIKEIEVKRSLGYGCDEEAIRLIKEGPRWNPATRNGINIETKVRVRVKFELK